MLIKSFIVFLLSRWKLLLGGLVAFLFLLPVPALALTFTGKWQAFIERQGKPKPPRPTFTDVTNKPGQKDTLTVNMGNYQGVKVKARSSIELARGFNISAASQLLKFQDHFAAQFAQAGADVKVTVKDHKGRPVMLATIGNNGQFLVLGPPPFMRTVLHSKVNFPSSTLQTFNGDLEKIFRLKKGHYVLEVQVVYTTNRRTGGWRTISPNQFEFIGL
jgi:hypothetical protein